jgi:hypothetical protein
MSAIVPPIGPSVRDVPYAASRSARFRIAPAGEELATVRPERYTPRSAQKAPSGVGSERTSPGMSSPKRHGGL